MTSGTPLLLYARWQMREALAKALVPPLLFAGLGGVPLWSVHRTMVGTSFREPGEAQRVALVVYDQMMPLAMTLGAVLLVNALVSADREKQHFRFLFSRPVVPWRFYLQHFVLSVVLFVACFAIIPVGFGLVVTAVPVFAALKSAALYALMIGALALLCGVLVKRDGLLFIIVAVFSVTLQQGDRAGALPRWASALADGLPPFGAADAVRAQWLAERAADPGDLALVLLYGAGMLVAALVLLWRAPLAR